MAIPIDVVVTGAVEGSVDEAVFERLVAHVGSTPGTVYGRRGKPFLRRALSGFNAAARYAPWLVLMDLDAVPPMCAPNLVRQQLPAAAPYMCFRIAVHEVESWLLADASELAKYLQVSHHLMPADPDSLPRPALSLVDIARQSRSRSVRDQLVPTGGSGAKVGAAYNSVMSEFVREQWRIEVAVDNSPSLGRCLVRLGEVVSAYRDALWPSNDVHE